jgi:hypothetical protein
MRLLVLSISTEATSLYDGVLQTLKKKRMCDVDDLMLQVKQAAPTCLTHHTFCLSTYTTCLRGDTMTQPTNVVKEIKVHVSVYVLHPCLCKQALHVLAKGPAAIAIIA